MRTIDPPVSTGLILVCEKCGKRMKGDSDKNPSRKLASRLKKMSRELFDKREVRVAMTSCLDICPPNRVSVAFVPVGRPTATPTFFTVKTEDIESTSHDILEHARQTITAKPQ
jgi:predicted metal-binding protein